MNATEAALLAAWEASDAGKAAWAAYDAAEDTARVASDAYYAARAAYLAKTLAPVTP